MKVLVAGDFSPRDRVADKIERGDTSAILAEVRPYIDEVGYAIVNFESTLAPIGSKPITKCGPNLCTTEKAIEWVRENGFDCITLANNHVLDYGKEGLLATIDKAYEVGLDIVGAGANIAEAQKVLYREVIGQKSKVKLAIVNICEHEYSIAATNSAGAAPIDPVVNYRQIQEARANADFVLVICHGGHEHYSLPSPRMKQLYRTYVDWGADAVINHHQHCFSGYEIYQGKPICYGVGNFCFDNAAKRGSAWDSGLLAILDTDKDAACGGLQLIGYQQCADDECRIKLADYESAVQKLNAVIADEDCLMKEWESFAESRCSRTLMRFAPYTNRVLRYMARKGWLPMFLGRERTSFLLNFEECESQRDLAIYALRKELNK